MTITKEMLEARKALYAEELQKLLHLAEVYKGALQDVEHWLGVIDAEQADAVSLRAVS